MGGGNVVNGGYGNRCDAVMDCTSSWLNPISPHSDREVPAIASPGSWVSLMGSCFGGTSAATPVTTAIAASLMGAVPGLK